MRRAIVLVVVLGLVAGLAAVSGEYNRDTVVEVMRGNYPLVQSATTANQEGRYYEAGVALVHLAEGMIKIAPYTPPKGTKAEWDRVMKAFIMAAFKGIGAAAQGNGENLTAALGELTRLNGEGHRMFR